MTRYQERKRTVAQVHLLDSRPGRHWRLPESPGYRVVLLSDHVPFTVPTISVTQVPGKAAFIRVSHFTAHYEVCSFFLFLTLMILALYFILESQRERKDWSYGKALIGRSPRLTVERVVQEAQLSVGAQGPCPACWTVSQLALFPCSQCGGAQFHFSFPWDQ